MDNKVIYTDWPGMKLGPVLAVDMDHTSHTYGWLISMHPDGQLVTLADLRPIAAQICEQRK